MSVESKLNLIGVIGGLSHESSDGYSASIHNFINQELGGHNNAPYVQFDINFAEVRHYMDDDGWGAISRLLSDAAASLVSIGAQYVGMASNTVHKVAPDIISRIGSEHFIHIGDCIAERCLERIEVNHALWSESRTDCQSHRVLLLGTLETMTKDFIKSRLERRNLEVVVPRQKDMQTLDELIFQQLCRHNKVNLETRDWYLNMILDMLDEAQPDVVVLGCTELSLLYNEEDLTKRLEVSAADYGPIAVVDSKQAHIIGLAQAALGQWQVSDL